MARVRFFSLLLRGSFFVMFVASMHAEKPFDFAKTPGKLPKQVVPTEYSIRIVPNIDKLTFTGSETVKVNAREPVRELVLNALELEIVSASVDDKPLPKSAIKIDKKEELLRLALPSELSVGDHTVAFTFHGQDQSTRPGTFLLQIPGARHGREEDDARNAIRSDGCAPIFPCWDEPSFRARFQLTAVVPENWMAVSNMPVETETKIDPPSPGSGVAGNGKEVRFAMTPSMSSYLNVFVAGELDLIETQSSGVQIRVITTKGKSEWGRYALESSAKILDYYNDYFGVSPTRCRSWIRSRSRAGSAARWRNWGGITYFEACCCSIRKNLPTKPSTTSSPCSRTRWRTCGSAIWSRWRGGTIFG